MFAAMMANKKFIQGSTRLVYENDNILVVHNFISYPDNTKEAVMIVSMIKDGQIIHMETGATRL